MTRRRNSAGIVLRIIFALILNGTAPGAAALREASTMTVEVTSLGELRQTPKRATAGSVIRLAAGTYGILGDDQPQDDSGYAIAKPDLATRRREYDPPRLHQSQQGLAEMQALIVS